MKKIIFIKDFVTKKKGEEWECSNQLSNLLVRHDKVAKYETKKKVVIKSKK